MNNHNLLGAEKSPYLLQHRHNPVHWRPWGEEAFAAAREEDKPIFLSIGYSTCYWCHVMEKDSFENQEVADVLNRYFISIKVDREERPDIDQIYMDAVVAMTGHGGWPLSAFLTTELKPFFAGTFIPRAQFIPLLERIGELWKTDREKIAESAEGITAVLSDFAAKPAEQLPDERALSAAYAQLRAGHDPQFGGFGRAPKFPPSMSLMLLMRIYRRTGEKSALEMAQTTLDRMARGGIYDHLGGGFARYSTDAQWLVPHFEKMLYDNALLARTYLEAAQLTKEEMFYQVARETLDYVLRDMRGAEGGFYSAEDAGEVGKEGEFYVWEDRELRDQLEPSQYERLAQVYGASPAGNFEHRNILNLQFGLPWSIKHEPLMQEARKKLLSIRNRRTRPHLDDKILTSWNALMISAFAKGYQVLNDERYLQAAETSARFLRYTLFTDGVLYRRWREGETAHRGFLDDYAFLVQAALDLFDATFADEWLEFAQTLQQRLDQRFWDAADFGYFYTEADAPGVLLRKKELTDGATPSGTGISALNLLRLYHLTFTQDYLTKAEQIFAACAPLLERYPTAFASTLLALDFYLDQPKEVVVSGSFDSPEARTFRQFLNSEFLPNKVVAWSSNGNGPLVSHGKNPVDGKTTVYVCQSNTCSAPTTDLEEAKEQLRVVRRFALQPPGE